MIFAGRHGRVGHERKGAEMEARHEDQAEERAPSPQDFIAPGISGEVLAQALLAVVPDQAAANPQGMGP